MGLLDEKLVDDAEHWTDTDTFGEAVTYHASGANAVSVTALIERARPENIPGSIVGTSPRLEAWIRNKATVGVTAVKVGDKITAAAQQGGTARTHAVVEILDQDAGMWHLLLR